jgi:hypothetical protein
MTLREFYRLICTLFNDGEPLPYKYTRKDGYWKMTKGYIPNRGREISLHTYAKLLEVDREWHNILREKTLAMRKQNKKIKTKYKGD